METSPLLHRYEEEDTEIVEDPSPKLNLLVLSCEDNPTTYFNFHQPTGTVGPIIRNLQRGIDSGLRGIGGAFRSVQLTLFDCKNQWEDLWKLSDEISQFEGVLIPGSLSDAHDLETKWIVELRKFIVEVIAARCIKTIGICFGHQMLASALGGKTGPNPEGGRVGSCQLGRRKVGGQGSMGKPWQLVCSHNDVVSELPENSVKVGDDESWIQMADYLDSGVGDRKVWARTIQAHPEYDRAQLLNCATCFLKNDKKKINAAMSKVDWDEVKKGSESFWNDTLRLVFELK